jgi:hypothetical protein
MKATKSKIDRYFGKCRITGCKTRRVVDSPYIADGHVIYYGGHNEKELRAAGLWCDTHNTYLKFDQLKGRYSATKECNGVCMGAVGPSCDCQCGGENHGLNHISVTNDDYLF